MAFSYIHVIAAFAIMAFTYTQGYSAGMVCTSDADCTGGCCYNDSRHGQQCHAYQNVSQACHLSNHQVKVMLYPCGCMAGLTCDEIHFDTSLPDPVHQAELLLLGHGYGICTDTPGTIFGK